MIKDRFNGFAKLLMDFVGLGAKFDDAGSDESFFTFEFFYVLNDVIKTLFIAGVGVVDESRVADFFELKTVWGRVDVFESLFDGLRRNVEHESKADGSGEILEVASTKE